MGKVGRFFRNIRKSFLSMRAERVILLGFLSYVLLGVALLSLPFAQKVHVGLIDNMFIASSAVSTTGLVTVSISDSYTLFGQIVVLLMIQLGGIGYMAFGSFIIIVGGRTLSQVRSSILKSEYPLPEDFSIELLIRNIILFTAVIEFAGALVLYFAFRSAGASQPFWSALFHSVSAFCTAGFGIYNNSMESFYNNPAINIVIDVLTCLGAIGFIVVTDIYYRITGKVKKITLTSRIILAMTFIGVVLGGVIIFVSDPNLKVFPAGDRFWMSLFQSVNAMTTAGFDSYPVNKFTLSSVVTLWFLMIIGASPSGTGGGLKTTTMSAIFAFLKSKFRGAEKFTFMKNQVPDYRIWNALATFIAYFGILFLAAFLLTFTDPKKDFLSLLFETASALGTVGLSLGITSALSPLSKLVLTLVMFIGRIGVLTFGVSLFAGSMDLQFFKDMKPKNKGDIAL